MTIRVLLADDEAIVRSGVAMILLAEPDLEVVAEVGDGAAAVAAVQEHRPDVAVLDLRMPVLDGVEAAGRIAALGLGTRVVVLTTFGDDDSVHAALRCGAAGFVLKHAVPAELVLAVRKVHAGQGWIDPALVPGLVGAMTERPDVVVRPPSLDPLTEREAEVLALIADGLSNAEIAARLHLSLGTVKIHVSRVLTKLGVADRTQAAVVVHRRTR